jgi:hypothetical protein
MTLFFIMSSQNGHDPGYQIIIINNNIMVGTPFQNVPDIRVYSSTFVPGYSGMTSYLFQRAVLMDANIFGTPMSPLPHLPSAHCLQSLQTFDHRQRIWKTIEGTSGLGTPYPGTRGVTYSVRQLGWPVPEFELGESVPEFEY